MFGSMGTTNQHLKPEGRVTLCAQPACIFLPLGLSTVSLTYPASSDVSRTLSPASIHTPFPAVARGWSATGCLQADIDESTT